MNKDAEIIRRLAWDYLQIVKSDRNAEAIRLHRAVNDLEPVRPVVLIEEVPWSEMQLGDELNLRCTDGFLRGVELYLRRILYQNRYMPADMVVPPYLSVDKVMHATGIGIVVKEDVLATDTSNGVVSHKYTDQLRTEDDLEKLHNPVISYDRDETLRRYALLGEIAGDILPVKLKGISAYFFSPWDAIATYRGVENLLTDLVDRPEFMHKIVQKLTDISLSHMEQYEALDLLETDPYYLHSTPAQTSDLPGKDYAGGKVLRKHIWGRGAAQIFNSVSKHMHDEFDIEYMKQTVGQCGLVYYGCCEPLDRKIDIVTKIPHLRKISITPWADVHVAAEAIGKKYVLSAKPNPTAVAGPKLNPESLRKEIGAILDACRRNNCSCDIVIKDISTCGKRPENLFEWERVVMEMVRDC